MVEHMSDNAKKVILIKNAMAVATMDDNQTVLKNADLVLRGPAIEAVGVGLEQTNADEVIDASGKVVLPGMVNTHHHLFQTLCRNVPRVQDKELFHWLTDLYQIWKGLTPEDVYVSALVGLGELLLTGCTTAADHYYVFPVNQPPDLLDRTAEAAELLGIRLCLTRGSMSRGKNKGGLPPDEVVQDEDTILKDSLRVIEKYHDPEPFSFCTVALAPCSPFSVTTELLRDTAVLAREKGVRLHTHLCETRDEEQFCLKKHGKRPVEYMSEVDWLGPDVWYAHGIYFNDSEMRELGRTKTSIAHCPTSNLRLGSGIAPVPKLREYSVPVGLAVDGSASNDSSDMLAETRMALYVHRIGTSVDSMSALDAFHLATRGGAEVLGRTDIGSLEPGKAADLSLWDMQGIAHAGGLHDPVAALLFCNARQYADTVFVHGRKVVNNGRLVRTDEKELAAKQNGLADDLLRRAEANTGVEFHRPG